MSDEIPQWAIEAFCDRANLRLNAVMDLGGDEGVVLRSAVRAGAQLIATHEQPPVDPLREEAIALVLAEAVTRTDNQIAAIKAGQAGEGKVELALAAIKRGIELASEAS